MLTPVDIEDRLDNLDRRLDRIEQILPTLATNEALHQTTEDLHRTTEALNRTNEALGQYATKEDLLRALENYPTKADLTSVVADLTDMVGHAFERAETNARILHEDLVAKIGLLGENRRKRH